MERYDRQYLLWGRPGQEILARTTLAVIGCGRAGFELATAAALLGIGRIVLFDPSSFSTQQFLLDLPAHPHDLMSRKAAEALSLLSPSATIDDIALDPSRSLLSLVHPDVILDASHHDESSRVAHAFGEEKGIPYFCFRMNRHEGMMDARPMFSHAAGTQGYIIAHLFAGLALDAVVKSLFRKHADVFAGLQRREGGRMVLLQDMIESVPDIGIPVSYDLCQRTDGSDSCTNDERGFAGSAILVVGAGSIGSHVVDMLARLDPSRVDIIDDDVFRQHNLNRQPLGYDAVGVHKARALSIKVGRISEGKVASVAYIGRVEEGNRGRAVGLDEKMKGGTIYDHSWFAEHPYDVIIGCVDNNEARLVLHEAALASRYRLVDAGSSPVAARVSVFLPGSTSCLDCTGLIKNSIFSSRAGGREPSGRRTGYEVEGGIGEDGKIDEGGGDDGVVVNRRGCTYQDGSVVMSNKVAAALAVAEARSAIIGGTLVDAVRYTSRSSMPFLVQMTQGPCACSTNFKYG